MAAVVITLLVLGSALAQDFDRNYVGVGFSPYTDVAPRRPWDQYSLQDIMSKLEVIRTRFSSITTYGMGVKPYNRGKSWDQVESNALISRAAATLNQQSSTKLRVNVGVDQYSGEDIQREINNAFLAAADANSRSPGTVWGITFTNEYIHSVGEGQQVLEMIRNNRNRARSSGLRVGTRTDICNVYTDQNNPLRSIMNQIAQESDYIYCNLYPIQKHAELGPSRAADEVMNFFQYVRSQLQRVNPNLEVMIGETGWPSEGRTSNISPNSVADEVEYWRRFNTLASQNRVKTQMFEAIDEPWKSDGKETTGENHYGWWNKPRNGENRLVEKANGR